MALTDFLSKEEQARIAEAIGVAEKCTSGEIVVHVTPKCKGDDVMAVAEKKFNDLKLYATERRNAVLIFIAFKSKKFAILGDKGINEVVPKNYWDQQCDTLGQYLAKGKPADGLCEVVGEIGQRLAQIFPPVENDVNELSNEVSFDEE